MLNGGVGLCGRSDQHLTREWSPAAKSQVMNGFVHGFVHETRRYGLRRGRFSGLGANTSGASAEVTTAA